MSRVGWLMVYTAAQRPELSAACAGDDYAGTAGAAQWASSALSRAQSQTICDALLRHSSVGRR